MRFQGLQHAKKRKVKRTKAWFTNSKTMNPLKDRTVEKEKEKMKRESTGSYQRLDLFIKEKSTSFKVSYSWIQLLTAGNGKKKK